MRNKETKDFCNLQRNDGTPPDLIKKKYNNKCFFHSGNCGRQSE
jgi:hypothetical protein